MPVLIHMPVIFVKLQKNAADKRFNPTTPGLTKCMKYDIINMLICRCGGIGRHKGLKIPRSKIRTGSSPVSGTKAGSPSR